MRLILLINLLGLVLAANAPALPVEEYLADSPGLWSLTSADWLKGEGAACFRAVSEIPAADLRYPGYADSPRITFLGFGIFEMILRFQAGCLSGVTMSFYNRGDAGELSESDFNALVSALEKALAAWTGRKGVSKPPQKLGVNAQVYSLTWPLANSAIEMKWSASRRAVLGQPSENPFPDQMAKGFRAEYIQLAITPPPPLPSAASAAAAARARSASAADIKKNVARDERGFVYIANIPMVDQGERGYCAVAAAERLLKYYGKDVDQHALAQLANTGTGGGTSPEAMLAMLKRMSLKFGIKVKTHFDPSPKNILNIVEKYNLQAAKEKRSAINPVEDNIIDIARIYARLDPNLLRRSRGEREKAGLKIFQADIVKCVDQGIPLAWSVMLGIVPETPALPQAAGGHMRIIYGYNGLTNEILYTDSWGAGHEAKLMSLADAWTITTGLFSCDPRY